MSNATTRSLPALVTNPACWRNPKSFSAQQPWRYNSDGHDYAWGAHGRLGIRGSGSAVRAGPVHYDDRSAVDCLLDGRAEQAGCLPTRQG
jgi:hypothetical protein